MILRTLFLILMVLCPLCLVMADDWPQWCGPDRTGISKETGLLESWPADGPKLLWTFREAGAGYSGMCVEGDRLYTMGADGDVDSEEKEYVYAIDLKTREKLWSTEVGIRGRHGPCSTPTIDGNFLYAFGSFAGLVCVEKTTGKKVWSRDLEMSKKQRGWTGYCESPLVDRDLVVVTPVNKREGAITAFDKKTGTLKWCSTSLVTDRPCSSLIAVEMGGVRQFVQMDGDNAVGVRASDGELLWKFPFEGVICTPICHNNCVYASSTRPEIGSKLIKLIPDDGEQFKVEEVYNNTDMQNSCGGVILVGDYLYGFSAGADSFGMICQDFKTGKTVWKEDTGEEMGESCIIFADGNLYCYYEKTGDVLMIKATPDGYKVQGKFRIPEESSSQRMEGGILTRPVVANGKLYLRDENLIFCYDIHKPK